LVPTDLRVSNSKPLPAVILYASNLSDTMKRTFFRVVVIFAVLLCTVSSASAGRVVVNNDEWTTSNTGFATAGAANATAFVQNLANFMNVAGGMGNFLVYANNIAYGSDFETALTAAGHAVAYDVGIPFDLPSLSIYDGIFLGGAGFGKNDDVLTEYVQNGGSVYLVGGTAAGNATQEADRWNGFLDDFGFQYGSPYNSVSGNRSVASSHPLFTGVTQLYFNNGNPLALNGLNSIAEIVLADPASSFALIGVNEEVPEPSTVLLLGLGLCGFGFLRTRRFAKAAVN
jgi:hypothetical protein